MFMFNQMQETQRDVSLDREPLADSVRSCEFPYCSNFSSGVLNLAGRYVTNMWTCGGG